MEAPPYYLLDLPSWLAYVTCNQNALGFQTYLVTQPDEVSVL